MGVISRDENQVNLIFAGSSTTGGQLKGFSESFEKPLLAIDIEKTMPSSTQWQELATTLNKSVADFINRSEVEGANDDENYDEDDWLKVLENNPKAMKGAILIEGDKTTYLNSATDVFKHFNVDSSGLEKTMHTEQPNIEKTSGNDRFVEE
ncbi:hypothetical protein Q2T40_10660 [Winogradskyella maritima]|uniref:Uncharacterized protein n=1 Tax=Winogradskyella maritima TaxID=1517766 RepID=A0ABV8AMC2_9FLAO|nr:hypothetical protein [Winogradskyella maritima]